jgi:hypothetical protein
MGKKSSSKRGGRGGGSSLSLPVPLWSVALVAAVAAGAYGYRAMRDAAEAAAAAALDAPWDPADGADFDAGSAQSTVVWSSETSAAAPEFPASLVLLPEELSKIVRTTVSPAGLPSDCGWSEFHTAYDRHGDVLLISIDRFFAPAVAAHLRRKAIGSTWAPADIHPDNFDKEDVYKGNGFPGLRLDTAPRDARRVTECARPVLALVDPGFDLDALHTIQTMYGLVDKELQPGRVWLDSQRMPHNDVRWDLGVLPDKTVPARYLLSRLLALSRAYTRDSLSPHISTLTSRLVFQLRVRPRADGPVRQQRHGALPREEERPLAAQDAAHERGGAGQLQPAHGRPPA